MMISSGGLQAQTNEAKLLDPKVRHGQLENGMSYYIMHNEKPKDRASFYLVQNVGAILEEDSQNGLAHMLEHLAFNGSIHFPDKGVKDFLERNGVEFGKNINAYTAHDETVYNISNVPVHPMTMDSSVWILYDWSGSLTLAEKEIENERAVVREEWRTRNNANTRMRKSLAEVNFYQSKYAKRDVIGDMDVVMNCDPQVLKDFYAQWYRTDLQAAVIVGDFDVDQMEERVKTILSQLPAHPSPAKRDYYTIAPNKGMLFKATQDAEAQHVSFSYHFKHTAAPASVKNEFYLTQQIKANLVSRMMSERLQDLLQQPDIPYTRARVGFYNYVRTQDVFGINAYVKEDQVQAAIQLVLEEIEKARQAGFSQSELDIAKANTLKGYEYYQKTQDNIDNDKHADGIQAYFLTKEPYPGPDYLFSLAKQVMADVSLDELNTYLTAWMTKDNAVFTIQGPEKETIDYPSKQKVLDMIAAAKAKKFERNADEDTNLQLLSKKPASGTITKSSSVEGNEQAKLYMLSNGAKVLLYPTDHANSEIHYSAFSKGGQSALPVDQLATALQFDGLVATSGVGDHDPTQLRKVLTGKAVQLELNLNTFTEGFSGGSDASDFETLLQLQYLYFTQPRFDKELFNVYLQRASAYYENQDKNPNSVFQDSIRTILSNYSPRRPDANKESLSQVNFANFSSIYRDRFSNVGDFTFVIVGDLNDSTVVPLIQKYIGGIPGKTDNESWTNHKVKPVQTDLTSHFEYPMEMPKHTNFLVYHQDPYNYSPTHNLYLEITASLIRNSLFESLREKEGGTYGARVYATYTNIPESNMALNVYFDSDPDKGKHLIQLVDETIANYQSGGATESEVQKVIESMLNDREQNLKNNGYILAQLKQQQLSGFDLLSSSNYEDILKAFSLKKYNKFIKKTLNRIYRYEIVMTPQAGS